MPTLCLAPQLWEPFARLVLRAAYDATLAAAHCKSRYEVGTFRNPGTFTLAAAPKPTAQHARRQAPRITLARPQLAAP